MVYGYSWMKKGRNITRPDQLPNYQAQGVGSIMVPKTENLVIVLTDIVGYTETTAQQSRMDNERLMTTHNRILLPLVKAYGGRLIKSIGDALLMVFRSPTDAMLCAMAMQDALFQYNRNKDEDQQIHIRVAASLGEVRVTRDDIFGEPVNTTSRIEGVTPEDEIYFSEAIYMAMNKAEVPSQEVGWKDLKGISEPIRLFTIPRFSTPHLIPKDVMASEDLGELAFPFGGAHLSHTVLSSRDHGRVLDFILHHKKTSIPAMLFVPLIAVGAVYTVQNFSLSKIDKTATVIAKPARPVSKPKTTIKKRVAVKAAPKSKPKPVETKPKPVELPYTSISKAKRDYKRDVISREEYKRVVGLIKKEIKQQVIPIRKELDTNKISRKEYKRQVAIIKKKYR